MKNKKILICLIFLITSIVISCSWQLPETVSVKTKADYEFGLGSINKDLSDMLDIPKMLETNGTVLPNGMALYDYNPTEKSSKVQHYLAKIPIVEFPLDIQQYLDQLNMAQDMEAINFEKSFKVPNIGIEPIKVPVPVSDMIPHINKALVGVGLVSTENIDLFPTKILEKAGVKIGNVTYLSGTLTIKGADVNSLINDYGIKLPPLSNGVEYEFSNIIRPNTVITIDFGTNSNGNSQVRTATTDSYGNATIDLTGIEIITSAAKIKFDRNPEIELRDATKGRSLSRAPTIPPTMPDISDIPLPDLDKIIQDNQDILQNPSVSTKKPVLVVEGYTVNIIPESKIKKVTGLTISDELTELIPVAKINKNVGDLLPASTGVVRCKIGEGDIGIKIAGLENAGYDMNVISKGGLNLEQNLHSDNTRVESTLDLTNSSIESGKETSINANAIFRINNTNITFDPAPTLILTPKFNKIDTATIDIKSQGEDVTQMLKMQKTFPLPEELGKFVQSIKLNNAGIKIKYTNTLPKSNDIKFLAKSNFLKIDKTTDPIVIQSGVTDKEVDLFTSAEVVLGEKPVVDFDVEIKLPKEPSDPDNYVTINGIESNKDYSISFNMKPILSWENIKVKAGAIEIPNGSMNTNLNLNEMISNVGEQLGNKNLLNGISITALPIYLFCTRPDIEALDQIAIQGQAKLFFGTETDGVITENKNTPKAYILGNEKGKENIKLVKSLPKLDINEKKTVTTNMDNITDISFKPNPGTLTGFIKDVMKTPGNLCVSYDIGIINPQTGGDVIQIDYAALQNSKNSSMALEAYIDLGLALSVDAPIEIDLTEKMNLQGDILQGNLVELKKQGINNILTVFEDVGVQYTIQQLPLALPKDDIRVSLQFNSLEKEIKLTEGKISITKDEITNLFEADTLEVKKLAITIPAGQFSILRDKVADFNLSVGIKTNGQVKLYEKDKGLLIGGGTK